MSTANAVGSIKLEMEQSSQHNQVLKFKETRGVSMRSREKMRYKLCFIN